jgi:acyl-CoA synthetase (AMP-forming)/AMP-acid ligase II
MAVDNFDSFDLAAFKMKLSTSAPFHIGLKRDVLERWPGGLIEIYGMTEGGGACVLYAHIHPDKLHTVGQPAEGHEIRLLSEDDEEAALGQSGEIVGHSLSMMTGYYGQPDKTKEIEWISPEGKRFFRSGDIGTIDEDGFISIVDRKKDMIISGGFNIYPSDLEETLRRHEAIVEAAVIGIHSERWGETPVAYVEMKLDFCGSTQDILDWANDQVGSVQRISDLRFINELPRSGIGKVLKKDLINDYCNS